METTGGESTFVIGHRGAAGTAPENTLNGIREAARQGARWVEFDVKLTHDGVPVLFHDESLARITGAAGRLAGISLADLRRLDAGGGEIVPTLAEAVGLLADLGLGANVELKPSPGREAGTGRLVGAALRKAGIPLLISSFSERALLAVRAVAPDLPRALLVGAIPRDWRWRLIRVGAETLHCRAHGLRRARVVELAAASVALRCYTVNDPGEARRLRRWGVSGVFTDFPGRLLAALGPS